MDGLELSEEQEWRMLTYASTVAAAIAVRGGIRLYFRLARHEQPPLDPLRRDADWSDAVLFGAATGATVGLARVLARTAAKSVAEQHS